MVEFTWAWEIELFFTKTKTIIKHTTEWNTKEEKQTHVFSSKLIKREIKRKINIQMKIAWPVVHYNQWNTKC